MLNFVILNIIHYLCAQLYTDLKFISNFIITVSGKPQFSPYLITAIATVGTVFLLLIAVLGYRVYKERVCNIFA
jgi:hypothetical protein